ncbi:hypothetical protein SEVIR_4G157350v4 [Setaria viridis]
MGRSLVAGSSGARLGGVAVHRRAIPGHKTSSRSKSIARAQVCQYSIRSLTCRGKVVAVDRRGLSAASGVFWNSGERTNGEIPSLSCQGNLCPLAGRLRVHPPLSLLRLETAIVFADDALDLGASTHTSSDHLSVNLQ